jgi:hypothetical protein
MMNRQLKVSRSLLIFGALIGCSLIAPQEAAPQPGEPRPLAEVPFTVHQGAVIVPAILNGRDTIRLLLDTGWGPLALVTAAVERLHLPLDRPGPGDLAHAELESIAVGQAVKARPFVEVFPTEALAPLIGPHDGVLGTAFFF